MPLQPKTVEFLKYLASHPVLRSQIRAAPGRTLLYAGHFMKPAWKEIAESKRTLPNAASKETLPDVLVRLRPPDTSFPTLFEYVTDVERQVPWKPDGFTVWRALSGIFAANAAGPVSFYVLSGVSRDDKVFAATELPVLERNPKIDPMTRDLLAYYRRCLDGGETSMNLGFMAG